MRSPVLPIVLVIVYFVAGSCNTKKSDEITTTSDTSATEVYDTASAEMLSPEEAQESATPPPLNIITFRYGEENEMYKKMEDFAPLSNVLALAARAIHLKDSLKDVRQSAELTDPNDTVIFSDAESKAYQAIIAYKKKMAAGVNLKEPWPALTALDRHVDISDSVLTTLTGGEKSNFFGSGKFFFMGGAPYIGEIHPDDGSVYADANGHPEMRYEVVLSNNSSLFLSSLFHARSEKMNITFGPPLNSYDWGARDVRGIGSLIHELTARLPVFFITRDGLRSGQLLSVTVKLVPQNMGCISDLPRIVLAHAGTLESRDILGVYIPYQSTLPTGCTIKRHSSALWTADLNDDGVPDVACITGSFEAISSDFLYQSVWLLNINGEWKVIDWASDEDCT